MAGLRHDLRHRAASRRRGGPPGDPGRRRAAVRQFRQAIRDDLVEVPAGVLDVEGEDALTAAARELEEETGFRHRSIEFLGGVYTVGGVLRRVRASVLGARRGRASSGEAEDGITLLRKPFREMVMAAKAGRIRDAKTALALLLADARGVLGER